MKNRKILCGLLVLSLFVSCKEKCKNCEVTTHTSPKTGKQWICKTDNMQLIDSTKNADNPLKKDLIHLKNICKE